MEVLPHSLWVTPGVSGKDDGMGCGGGGEHKHSVIFTLSCEVEGGGYEGWVYVNVTQLELQLCTNFLT